MIIVKLYGGLGNQLFQYALARKLSLKFNTPLLFDITTFENYKLHKYALAHFNLQHDIATSTQLAFFFMGTYNRLWRLICGLAGKMLRFEVIREKQFTFDDTVVLSAKKHTYLSGYWQSEKYFADIRETLLNDLIITNDLIGRNLEMAGHIKSVISVSLHIRRGDYVTNKKILGIHGLCDIDYYIRAIEYLSGKMDKFVLFVFSDDMPWVKENFKADQETYFVDNNEENNYEDLRLMSLCKHNIIANSSFSWWGAWLNQNPGKIVIAPKQWFADSIMNSKTIDLIPGNWIRI